MPVSVASCRFDEDRERLHRGMSVPESRLVGCFRWLLGPGKHSQPEIQELKARSREQKPHFRCTMTRKTRQNNAKTAQKRAKSVFFGEFYGSTCS
jgi:hypothetical protein